MAAILSQYSTTGFYKAPVSKGLLGCMFLTSCALNVPLLAHLKQYVVYSIPDIFEKYEIWRVFTSKLAFVDTKDLVCSSLLLYYFRIFERRYGSHRFSSYVLATCTVATILEMSTVFCLRQMDINIIQLPTGPYGIIFPLFINYFLDVPRVAQTYIIGIPVTGKTLTYLLGLQVLSTSKESMISGLCCLVAGAVVRWNVLRVQDVVRVPQVLSRLAKTTLGWLLRSSPPQEGIMPMGATLEIQRQQQVEILEQQMWTTRTRDGRDRSNSRRLQIAQGYAERLLPPAENNRNSFLGDVSSQEFWDNAFNLRQRRNVNQNGTGLHLDYDVDTVAREGVTEEQVQTLVEMGFERQNVVRALQSSNNDINLATTILLNES